MLWDMVYMVHSASNTFEREWIFVGIVNISAIKLLILAVYGLDDNKIVDTGQYNTVW